MLVVRLLSSLDRGVRGSVWALHTAKPNKRVTASCLPTALWSSGPSVTPNEKSVVPSSKGFLCHRHRMMAGVTHGALRSETTVTA